MKHLLLIFISITILKCVISVDIECDFMNDDFDAITNQYTCDVKNNLMINSKNVVIQTFRGSHTFSKTSNDVTGLSINDKRIQFMPKNLGEKFKNLNAIKIRHGRLKEISFDDMKPFKNLRYLNLDANDIEVLEDDLFEFNPQLEIIWFEGNRIKNVGHSVFDNLKSLNDLDLNGNVCISKRMSNSRGMAEFIREVKKNCFDASLELVKFKQKFKEANSKSLTNSDVIIAKNDTKPRTEMLISNKDVEIEELRIVVRNLTEVIKIKDAEDEENLSKNNLKIKKKDEILEKCENDLAIITSEKNQSTIQLTNCQNNLESLNINWTAKLSEKSNKTDEIDRQLVDLQITLSKSLEDNQNLVNSCNNTELKLQDIDMESLPTDLDEKIKEYKRLDTQLKKRETDLKTFEEQVAGTIADLTKYKEKIEKLLQHKKQEIVNKDNIIKKLKAANTKLQNKNNQLQSQLKNITLRSIDLEKVVKDDIASYQELNKTKALLEIEKLKFQELEVKYNGTLENRTIECLVHQDLQTSNQLQQEIRKLNDTENNLVSNCPEQLQSIQAKTATKDNRIKGLLIENKQLKNEKVVFLTKQRDLRETISNKTEISKALENIITLNEAVINELLSEKSQLKMEVDILADSEKRLKNSLSKKYSSCNSIIEKLNQDLKNSSQIERSLKEDISVYKNIIKTDNVTKANLNDEINYLRNQKIIHTASEETQQIHNELKNCTKIVNDLRQKNLELEIETGTENYRGDFYDDDDD